MIDTHELRRDPRRHAAMMTDHGSSRGWDFRPSDEPPMWLRAVAEVLRPRSIVIIAVIAITGAVWWL